MHQARHRAARTNDGLRRLQPWAHRPARPPHPYTAACRLRRVGGTGRYFCCNKSAIQPRTATAGVYVDMGMPPMCWTSGRIAGYSQPSPPCHVFAQVTADIRRPQSVSSHPVGRRTSTSTEAERSRAASDRGEERSRRHTACRLRRCREPRHSASTVSWSVSQAVKCTRRPPEAQTCG
jgi:hypothetical protein